jgi:hypothetical protein
MGREKRAEGGLILQLNPSRAIHPERTDPGFPCSLRRSFSEIFCKGECKDAVAVAAGISCVGPMGRLPSPIKRVITRQNRWQLS